MYIGNNVMAQLVVCFLNDLSLTKNIFGSNLSLVWAFYLGQVFHTPQAHCSLLILVPEKQK